MFQKTAIDIAYQAGNLLLEKLHSGFSVEHKGDIDLVTDADRASEKLVTSKLLEAFPSHSILAEEQGILGNQDSKYRWVIDPIDGTTNFAHRFGYFAVSIALLKNDEPLLGVVFNPLADEMFVAEKGKGAFLNGQSIRVSRTKTLNESLLVSGFPYDIKTTEQDNLANFARLTKLTQGVRRTGSAALDLCHVACGRFDGYWEFSLNPWDVAGGVVILTEAGGWISQINGDKFTIDCGQVLATNGEIHSELLGQLVG